MKKSVFFGEERQTKYVYAGGRRDKVAALTDLYPVVITKQNWDEHIEKLEDRDVVFSTWGMPALTQEQLDQLPNLKAVFYAAGSVQPFARPFLERGILLTSSWKANAVPVAEFTLAQILLSCKGYFRNTQDYHATDRLTHAPFVGRGVYGETIAILGAGAIGRLLIQLLRPFHVKLIVFDPFLTESQARDLDIEKVTLEDAFRRAYIVTNHLADKPEIAKMINATLFGQMRDDATFINTGRGRTVDEDGLMKVFRDRPSLTALLDVTHPEPPLPDSPFYTMPNIHLSTHIAGSLGDEVIRMADYAIEEFMAWERGEPLRYNVTLEMLETMA